MSCKRPIWDLDPRTKIFLLLGVNVFIFTNHNIFAEIMVILGIVLINIFCGTYKVGMKTLVTYMVLLGIQYMVLPYSPKLILNSLNILVITCRKLLPCVSIGTLLVQTTPIRKLMYALKKWHLPQSFIIPLSITIRYFPTLAQDYRSIRDAVRLRKIWGFKKLEFVAIPLILSASSTADELSQAMIVRGIDHPIQKTCCESLKLGCWDVVIWIVSGILMILPIVFR